MALARGNRKIASVLAAALLAVYGWQQVAWYRHLRPDTESPEMLGCLHRNEIRGGLADYWISYRLSFDTRERIISTEYVYTGLEPEDGRLVPSPRPSTRYPPWQRKVEHSDHAFVVFRNDPMPRRQLAAHGYERHVVGPFAVYARR